MPSFSADLAGYPVLFFDPLPWSPPVGRPMTLVLKYFEYHSTYVLAMGAPVRLTPLLVLSTTWVVSLRTKFSGLKQMRCDKHTQATSEHAHDCNVARGRL